MTQRMIYHHPLPLDPEATSASGIRPCRMREAFQEIGYEVWEVTGYSKERRAKAGDVEHAMRAGVHFDFCYSESSTMPMTMTNPNHLPTDPLLDSFFFRHLHRSGVPVGQFLRDIYWRFPPYRRSVRFPKREAALAAYAYDMWTLRHHVDHVFLPSVQMAKHVNLGNTPFSALPPAHAHDKPLLGPAEGISLFYVGGIGSHYSLHRLFEGVKNAHRQNVDVKLTVCVRPDDWDAVKHEYAPYDCPAIQIVHGHGAQLRPYFEAANIASLFVEPMDYWQLAVPVKLYDYIGAGKPILTSQGTLPAQLVEEQGLGWAIEYNPNSLLDFLVNLSRDPNGLTRAREAVLAHREVHSWRERARQVVATLTG